MNPQALRSRVKTLDIFHEIEQELPLVEESIEDALSTSDSMLSDVSTHLLKAGGKRIRPALVLLAAKFDDYNFDRVLPIATAVELVHMATLVHDDVVDKASVRRGIATVNARWSNQVSVLTGDYLFAKAFSILAASCDNRVIRIMADVVYEMSRGELRQIETAFDLNQNEDDYFLRIKQKTAYFIAECCRLGALAGGGSEADLEALYKYGMGVGLSFQIADDLLDFKGSARQVGKPVGGDLRSGILTLPVLHGLHHADEADDIRRLVVTRNLGDEEIRRITEILETGGSFAYASSRAEELLTRAIAELDAVPGLQTRDTLRVLANFVVNRNY